MEEVKSSGGARRRRSSRSSQKKSFFDKIHTYFISDGISYRKEKNIVKKRKKLLKKILEYILWGLVVGILIMALIDIFSEVSFKDRRNTGKSTRKRAFICPDYSKLPGKKFSLIKFAYT